MTGSDLADRQISSSTQNNDLLKKMLNFIKIKTSFHQKSSLGKQIGKSKNGESICKNYDWLLSEMYIEPLKNKNAITQLKTGKILE